VAAQAVVADRLHKSYRDVVALDEVSFEVEQGEVVALLGPNGAGKTTTLEILEGFRTPDAGFVRVLGVDPSDRRSQRWFHERIGVVLQEMAIEPYFSVAQVLRRNAGFFAAPRPVDEVIDLVGLTEQRDARAKGLSGGQRRRLDIGLGIVGNPELLFLDEPTTGLDPSARRATWSLIRRLADEGTTVILTSHYMDEVEALAGRVVVLSGGTVVATGTPASIGRRDEHPVTIQFDLPWDVSADELPVTATFVSGRRVEIRAEDDLRVLAALVGWALDRDVRLRGLTVTRTSLEEIYLSLTQGHERALPELV